MQTLLARHRFDGLCFLCICVGLLGHLPAPATASSLRHSAIVRAVAQAKPAIVNINGQKTVAASDASSDETRRVNGMGTGVIVDPRGYVITNYHVVDGVRRINVTLADGSTHTARLVARDPYTDLAIIRISTDEPLPLLKIGTSSDLMEGEQVVAIGNAYGYPHTTTIGYISALNRSVQVSDSQKYYDLIQTDASINPGNSGGPLLNVDGEMIGINVAVRVGAQGIGFAIPVDRAMEVAADLLSVERLKGLWHGIEGETKVSEDERSFVVKSVDEGSPAADIGIRTGDLVRRVDRVTVHNRLDLERALLAADKGKSVSMTVERDSQPITLNLVLASAPRRSLSSSDRHWRTLGMKLEPVSEADLRKLGSPYSGGLRVTALRADGPAARQGIRKGDVLVGMHKWETVSLENINYILNRSDLLRAGRVKFYVVRGSDTLYGHLPLIR